MGRRTIVFSSVLTVIAAGMVALAVAAQRRSPPPSSHQPSHSAAAADGPLPVLWRAPPFSFTNQHGQTVTAEALRGHVWIADFVFTRCTSVCPLITAKMAMLQRRLESRKSLRFVSFSVDPANDTPDALKRYAAEWRPNEPRWTLLSTTPPELQKLAAGMYVAVEPAANDIAHSQLFFLIDATGGVRGIYESDKDDALERLVRDTETLLEAAGPAPDRADASGRELYENLGCDACHARSELAPPLDGLLGRRVELSAGNSVVADAAYVRESIVRPEAKLVQGYALRMPSYAAELTPAELDALVEHTLMLASAAPAGSSGKSPDKKALVAVDPVCSMDVRVVETTPRATHAGRTVYFCSEVCRKRFLADPGRYEKGLR